MKNNSFEQSKLIYQIIDLNCDVENLYKYVKKDFIDQPLRKFQKELSTFLTDFSEKSEEETIELLKKININCKSFSIILNEDATFKLENLQTKINNMKKEIMTKNVIDLLCATEDLYMYVETNNNNEPLRNFQKYLSSLMNESKRRNN